MKYISDDDDPDNNYESVEKIINSILQIKYNYHINYGLSKNLLSFLFRLLPNHSLPNRTYSCAKISNLGYRKVISLRTAISDLVTWEINNTQF